jgi:hypothetical protein
MLRQGTFLTFLVSAAGTVSEAVADLGGGVMHTSGVGVVTVAIYSNVMGLWSLSNTCACRGGWTAGTS